MIGVSVLVREFTEEKPFVGEAWYYGKAKGREDKLVIRARVLGDRKVLEFFVASNSTLMLTGMLAELKADLNKELGAQRGMPQMRQVTAPEEVDAVAMVRTLLDKATEAEIGAGGDRCTGVRFMIYTTVKSVSLIFLIAVSKSTNSPMTRPCKSALHAPLFSSRCSRKISLECLIC